MDPAFLTSSGMLHRAAVVRAGRLAPWAPGEQELYSATFNHLVDVAASGLLDSGVKYGDTVAHPLIPRLRRVVHHDAGGDPVPCQGPPAAHGRLHTGGAGAVPLPLRGQAPPHWPGRRRPNCCGSSSRRRPRRSPRRGLPRPGLRARRGDLLLRYPSPTRRQRWWHSPGGQPWDTALLLHIPGSSTVALTQKDLAFWVDTGGDLLNLLSQLDAGSLEAASLDAARGFPHAGARAGEPSLKLESVLAVSAGALIFLYTTLISKHGPEAAAENPNPALLFFHLAAVSCLLGELFKIKLGRFHEFFKAAGIFSFFCVAGALALALFRP